MRGATDGAAFCAAPDRGSDQRRNGTQDVNDPASGPAMRPPGAPRGRSRPGFRVSDHRADAHQSPRKWQAPRARNSCEKYARF